MRVTFKVEGLKELERALLQLKTATAKRLMRKVLMAAAQPVADDAYGLAPDDPSTQGRDLKASIGVGTQLSKRQRRLARRMSRSGVEVYVGAGAMPHAHLQEFGTVNHPAHPFMRPAWDSNKDGVMESVKAGAWAEIEKVAERERKKAQRLLGAK